MACPVSPEFLPHCRCPFSEPVIQTREFTYYTGCGILQSRGVMYWSSLVRGPHCFNAVMHAIAQNRVSRHSWNRRHFVFVTIEYGTVIVLQNSKNNHDLLSCLLRMQRAVRAFLRRRWEAKLLAVAMGLHPRLGVRSGLNCLCSDVMQRVAAPESFVDGGCGSMPARPSNQKDSEHKDQHGE
jgi:hypothetical protein